MLVNCRIASVEIVVNSKVWEFYQFYSSDRLHIQLHQEKFPYLFGFIQQDVHVMSANSCDVAFRCHVVESYKKSVIGYGNGKSDTQHSRNGNNQSTWWRINGGSQIVSIRIIFSFTDKWPYRRPACMTRSLIRIDLSQGGNYGRGHYGSDHRRLTRRYWTTGLSRVNC